MSFDEKPREECGIVGILNCPEAANWHIWRSTSFSTGVRRAPASAPATAAPATPQGPRPRGRRLSEVALDALPGRAAIGHVPIPPPVQTWRKCAALLANYTTARSPWRTTATLSTPKSCERSSSGAEHLPDNDRQRNLLHLIAHASTSDRTRRLSWPSCASKVPTPWSSSPPTVW